ncbi:MAG TPA: hypothetical protein VL199_04650 [Burkholderiales bacterium]|jgi:hypothetical protein|nr:hypothetical protein [Burkholderiales bacterium]
MTILSALLLVSAAWAQPNPNGEPSEAVQQQQKQAVYARKGHPQSGKPQTQEPASLRTKDSPVKPTQKPKSGSAAVRTQK